jgi:hypothetical protein
VYPKAPDSLARTFAQFDTLQWEWVSRKVTVQAGTPGLDATATVDAEVNIMQRSSRTGETRNRDRRVFTLEKLSGRWWIVSYGAQR